MVAKIRAFSTGLLVSAMVYPAMPLAPGPSPRPRVPASPRLPLPRSPLSTLNPQLSRRGRPRPPPWVTSASRRLDVRQLTGQMVAKIRAFRGSFQASAMVYPGYAKCGVNCRTNRGQGDLGQEAEDHSTKLGGKRWQKQGVFAGGFGGRSFRPSTLNHLPRRSASEAGQPSTNFPPVLLLQPQAPF